MTNTALVLGATGLVGSQLVKLLLDDDRYQTVKVFHRRTTGIDHPKLEEHIINFEELDSWKHLLVGDELFSALGTTIKKAGSQEKQYTIDFTYPFETAKAAAENGVKKYALVSSAGANPKSRMFYSRLKGELDDAVKNLPFELIAILRPSILAGDREERRPGEQFGMMLARIFTKIPGITKYRPIPARMVAQSMINALHKYSVGYHIFELDEVFHI